jgi:hypothetical protein
VKVLLRNQETGQYYAGADGWSASSSGAHDFTTVGSASQLALTSKLKRMEVVLHYEHPPCDLVLPLMQEA